MRASGHLLILLFLCILTVAACERPITEQPQPARDTTRQATEPPATYAGYRWDTAISFDTTSIYRLILDHTRSSTTLDHWAAGNLDDDPQGELVLVVTTWLDEQPASNSIEQSPRFIEHLIVIDSSATGARVIFDTEVQGTSQEGAPEIGIFNPSIPSSAFYVEYYSARGSGALFIHHRIFRIWRGKVYESNDLLAQTSLQMCPSIINQDAESQISQPASDHFVVKYRYQFFVNGCEEESILDSTCGGYYAGNEADHPLALVSGPDTVTYNWDSTSVRFIPDYRGTRLSPEKMKCLMLLGPDEIFLAAYREEVEKVAGTSRSGCRRALARFALDNL